MRPKDDEHGTPATFRDTETLTAEYTHAEHFNASDNMEHRFAGMQAVDWVWEQFQRFIGHEGKSLTDTMVRPLTGDYTKIANNAVAWEAAKTQLDNLGKNLNDNTKALMVHWTEGPARDECNNYVNRQWTLALIGAAGVAKFMSYGFQKLSDGAQAAAKMAIRLIDDLVKYIAKTAAKEAWPGAGVAVSFFEWVKNGFDKFPYWEDIQHIKKVLGQVLALHQKIRNLVNAMKTYVEVGREMLNIIGQIPDVRTTRDAYDVATGLGQSANGVADANKKFNASKKDLNKQLTEMDKMAPADPDKARK